MPTAGTYRLSCGEFFYIGSSSNLVHRKRDHQWRLRAGIHKTKCLQDAFNVFGCGTFTPLQFFKIQKNEADQDFRNRLRNAEQELLDQFKTDPFLLNKSSSAFGPDNGEVIRKMWQDPEYRKIAAQRLSKAATNPSAETREKMASAKRGAKNRQSRPVIVKHPDGSTTRYESTVAAATFFGTSQQLFDTWIKGTAPWPGTGKHVRTQYAWIAPYSASYES